MSSNIGTTMRRTNKPVRTLKIRDSVLPYSAILCGDCKYALRCASGFVLRKCIASRDKRPCYRKRGSFNFYYDNICCFTYDCINYKMTDYGMYSRSTEISVYIKQSLNKLAKWMPYIQLSKEHIDYITKTFKKHRHKTKGGDILWIMLPF